MLRLSRLGSMKYHIQLHYSFWTRHSINDLLTPVDNPGRHLYYEFIAANSFAEYRLPAKITIIELH